MKLKMTFLFVLIAIGLHFYLTFHYFDLSFGMLSDKSVCNINANFNCDVVSASRFASVFAIPVALWGAMANILLALILLGWMTNSSANMARLARYNYWLAGMIALTSVVMGGISTFLVGSFCTFCIMTYLISFIVFALIHQMQDPQRKSDGVYLVEIFTLRTYTFPIVLLAIPALVFITNSAILNEKYKASGLGTAIRNSVNDWKANPEVTFKVEPSLIKGSAQPKMVITEFADFLCGHCKMASMPISAFVSSHPDVQLRFYSFPLDGTCNEALKDQRGDGLRCYLSKAVFCAERQVQKGWPVHEAIFAAQEQYHASGNMEFAKKHMTELAQQLHIDFTNLTQCIESPETDSAIRAQALDGKNANITGTPSFFINNRRLDRGSLIPALEAVHTEVSK